MTLTWMRPYALLLVATVFSIAGCAPRKPAHHELIVADGDILALSDSLEALIGDGRDTPADREYAYEIAHRRTDDTASVQFARAAITGRLVQQKGLLAADLVSDIERSARRSRELDPNFRNGAATRLLGTLYVMAPAPLLQHGDSETGVELLEGLAEARPDVPENRLRLAEAYIALSDPDPARSHLCFCLEHIGALRRDDQQLLAQLIANVGAPDCSRTKP
ncbi:MAG TPA: tetratricopeptide repeat protein [Candidatus Binatia bacterium]|nr:tetratricopeptide repeat protein [Candidatus Binatia bacterium]